MRGKGWLKQEKNRLFRYYRSRYLRRVFIAAAIKEGRLYKGKAFKSYGAWFLKDVRFPCEKDYPPITRWGYWIKGDNVPTYGDVRPLIRRGDGLALGYGGIAGYTNDRNEGYWPTRDISRYTREAYEYATDKIGRHADILWKIEKRENIKKAKESGGYIDGVSYVYCFSCGDFLKIGYSANPRNRCSGIGEASPHDIVIESFSAHDKDLVRDVEQGLHERFSHLRHKREWFKPRTKEEREEVVKAVKDARYWQATNGR